MTAARIASVKAEIAALEADGIDHYDLDGRLARLEGKDLFLTSKSWDVTLQYHDQSRPAQEFYDGWVRENLSLRLSEDIKHAKAA
jgi:hypothetical protein